MTHSTLTHSDDHKSGNKYRFKQLQELEKEILWDELLGEIEPHYLVFCVGRNLVSAETMLRIYFIQLRYGMSAGGAEEALFQIEVLRKFALIDSNRGVIPDESSIAEFFQLIKEIGMKNKLCDAFYLE